MEYRVDPATLTAAAGSISDIVVAASGTRLTGISIDAESAGHPGVAGALSGFCATWQVATTDLAARANAAGDALTAAAATYVDAEEAAEGSLPKWQA